MPSKILHNLLLLLLLPLSSCHIVSVDSENKIYQDRYLLLDSRIIEKVDNAKLSVGKVTKHPDNPLLMEDKPWEKRFDNLYGNMVYDETDGIYKLWYSPFIVDYSAKGMSLSEMQEKEYMAPKDREMAICYATSQDGIEWEKPNLGLVNFNGSTNNNILWRGPHGAGIYKDPYEKDSNRLYKMLTRINETTETLATSYSSDGIIWSKPSRVKLDGLAGDTHNNLLWDSKSETYVGITRTWGEMGREVMRIESNDFNTWKKDKVVMTSKDKIRQPYAMPVFFHAGVFLGLVAVHEQPPVDRVWTELAWSPDTKIWHRIDEGTPLIPCSDKVLDYDYGCVYSCTNPIFLKNEIRIYYGGSDYLHYEWRTGNLSLATLRPDGFAGYRQLKENKSAIILTKDIPYTGKRIRISCDVEDGGSVNAEILDKKGNVLSDTQPIKATVTDGALLLSKPVNVGEIRLRFTLNNAILYSFSFQ